MRELTSHKVNGLNEALKIEVLDEPGAGGANHVYGITDSTFIGGSEPPKVTCPIRFQNGPIAEAGVNGISGEALLAIVEDRLKCFQAGASDYVSKPVDVDQLVSVLRVSLQRVDAVRLASEPPVTAPTAG